MGYEVTIDDDPKATKDATITAIDPQSQFGMVLDQFSLDSIIADQIGFTVLPNREICVAGVKMAGQRMPKDLSDQIRYLLGLWEWIAPMLKLCTQASNETRYIAVLLNPSKYATINK